MLSASIIEKIDEWIASNNEGHRGHLGFSVIGDEDEHKQWMSFHWCLPSDFDGRMLRLFDLGNRIEDQVVDNIRDSKEATGVSIRRDPTPGQMKNQRYGFALKSHRQVNRVSPSMTGLTRSALSVEQTNLKWDMPLQEVSQT